ncbi:hypothetical protein AAE478_007551 [Parahypoxylon ruwenzoriense]
MSSSDFIGMYQRYKSDVDSIAAWLASTAKSLGYPNDLFQGTAAVKVSGRLKGKARAEAKKKQGSSDPKSTPTNIHIVKMEKFIPLAEFIASKPQLSIPVTLEAMLNRVISTRSDFAETLEKHGVAMDKITDAKEDYFVSVLKKVLGILKPRMIPSSMDSAGSSTGQPSGADFVTRFAELEVSELLDEFLKAPDAERPNKVGGDTTTYEVELQSSFLDVYIALEMVLIDLNEIRSCIKWIWSTYRGGSLDLVAAAISTNTAIELAKYLTDEIEPLLKKHGGTFEVLGDFWVLQTLMRNTPPFDTRSNRSGDKFNYDNYDLADGVYFLRCRSLDSLTRTVQPGEIPLYRDGKYRPYDPRSDRASKSGYEKFEEDEALLLPFFTELMAVQRGIGNYPVEDEFLRGIRELDKAKTVPFYLVFATQVFLDIHYTLRQDIERGFITLTDNLKFFHSEIDEHLKFHSNLKIDHWSESSDKAIRMLQANMKYISQDPVYMFKVLAYQRFGQPVPATMGTNNILKMSPVLSGLMLYRFRAEMYDAGLAISNASGSITYSQHLCNALRAENLLMLTEWPDMALVHKLLGGSNSFVREPPTGPWDYYKRFCLQAGTTAAEFANRRRRNLALKSRSGPCGIEDGVPVSRMFHDRYLQALGQVDWKPEHIAKIIEFGLMEVEEEGDGALILSQIFNPEKLKGKGKDKEDKKGRRSVLLPPRMLIQRLAFSLHREAIELSLPYTVMHRECWSLLRAVRQRCDPLLRQLFTPPYIERETQLPFVVGFIFLAAAEKDDKSLLSEAADALRSFVRTDGNRVIKQLEGIGMRIESKTEDEDKP